MNGLRALLAMMAAALAGSGCAGMVAGDYWSVERPVPALARLFHELADVVRLGTGADLEVVGRPPAADQLGGNWCASRGAGIRVTGGSK